MTTETQTFDLTRQLASLEREERLAVANGDFAEATRIANRRIKIMYSRAGAIPVGRRALSIDRGRRV